MRHALTVLWAALALLWTASAWAQSKDDDDGPPRRAAAFEWDSDKKKLHLSVSYRDIVDREIRKKLSRGLPTTIVFTATLYRPGVKKALSTTVQTCKVTWHVWEEAYRVEIRRPNQRRLRWVATVGGVLRRCVRARKLLIADSSQLKPGQSVFASAKVQVNPISADLLKRLKRWVSRPSGTSTAAPGDALFSTFTGLFLQRIGDAERELEFDTNTVLPKVEKKPEKSKGKK